MEPKPSVTILYDAAEDVEKARAEKAGKPFPLAYAQVADALEKRGYAVHTAGVKRKIGELVNAVEKDGSDVIFNLCEAIAGLAQHEHNVVGLLELYQKCYTGSGSAGWLLASDKGLSKKILQFHGIRYPRFCTVEQGNVQWADDLEFPLIVKPLNEDASLGIDAGSVVHSVKELLERISRVTEDFRGGALVEEFIEGREIYVGVLGNDQCEAFPILEWDFSGLKHGPRIAGAEAKWDRESEAYHAPEVFPEDIPADVVQRIHEIAVATYRALRVTGYARVDMRLRRAPEKVSSKPRKSTNGDRHKAAEPTADSANDAGGWECFVIEVNPNCWLEKRSEFAMAGRKHGLSYPDLLERIVHLAQERHAHSVFRPTAARKT